MSLSTFNTQIIGRLGQDATSNNVGEYYAIKFSIAISEKRGEENMTSWINCTYWSKTDKMLQYLTKGKLVSAVADWFSVREHEGKKYFDFRIKDVNPFLEKQEAKVNDTTAKTENNPFADEDDEFAY